MRKKTLVILTLIGLGLSVIGVIIITLLFISLTFPNCLSLNICGGEPNRPVISIIALAIGAILILASSVIQIVAWIGALVKQAKQQQWAWFVCTILFGALCMWLYLIIVPEMPVRQVMMPVYVQPYPPYQQQFQSRPPEQPS